jgi:anti-sigma regulatory factor (Ser/Thr protein kinase)
MRNSTASDSKSFHIQSPLDLHMAVAHVARMPGLTQCSPVDLSMLATVVAELGSNILKYAGQGHIRIQCLRSGYRSGVDIVAEDAGPGIADVAQAMEEHYSSSGTLGLGLTGVRRMVSEFHIASAPGQGCRVQARKWMTHHAHPAGPQAHAKLPALAKHTPHQMHAALGIETAEVNRPCYPEIVSGDSTVVRQIPEGLLVACIDASGHGKRAHALSQQLAQWVHTSANPHPATLLQELHQQCVGTLGAAAALAWVQPARGELLFAGVGNIPIRCVGRTPWAGISRDGMLGERFPTPHVQRFPLYAEDVVLLYSDGIRETISTQMLRRARLGSAQQIAEHVLREGGKTTDDASCIVLKCKS